MKRRSKVALFAWHTKDPNWKGWQGFRGLFKNTAQAMESLNDRRRPFVPINRVQIVSYRTLKVIATYERLAGEWKQIDD